MNARADVRATRAATPTAFARPLHDPQPLDDAPRNALERALAPWLADRRDLAIVRVVVRWTLVVPPAGLVLFMLPTWAVAVAALPWLALLYGVFGGPLLLAVHASTHRPITRPGRARRVERAVRAALLLPYGIAPGLYRAHHVDMHHAADNGPRDRSSTWLYRRDDPWHFARYFARFVVAEHRPFFRQLRALGHGARVPALMSAEGAWLALLGCGLALRPAATLVAGVAPYLLTRFFLMAGNWAQHAFVQADRPADPVANATVLINCAQNRRCFNDGYHAVHHRAPRLHWADLSRHFAADAAFYAEKRVLVFDGVSNQQVVWWRLMRGDLGWLADRLVPMPYVPADRGGRIALLDARLQPVAEPSGRSARESIAKAVGERLSR